MSRHMAEMDAGRRITLTRPKKQPSR
jgi:hypothetical protein